MGGYGPLIAGQMAQRANTDIAYNRQLEDQQRQAKLGLYSQAWNQTTDPTQRQAILQGISLLYPTPAHAPKFLQDIGHLFGWKGNQQAAQPQAPVAPPPSGGQEPTSQSGALPTAQNPVGVLQGEKPQLSTSPQEATPSPQLAQLRAVGQAPTAADAIRQITGIPSPVETQMNVMGRQAELQQALKRMEIEGQLREIQERAHLGVGVTPENRYLQQFATEHGYDYASQMPAELMAQALTEFKRANVVPTWKMVPRGNDIYAVDAHNPNDPGKLIGNKNDFTSRLTYKTGTNPDGSTFLQPVMEWTKKGSSTPILETLPEGEAGAVPVSANTPQPPITGVSIPPNGGAVTSTEPEIEQPLAPARPGAPPSSLAATNATIQEANANSKKLNKGKKEPASGPAGGRIPFGSKGSPILKSDTAVLTKLTEEANTGQKAYLSAQGLLNDPNRVSDMSLVFDWVRANIQGTGRIAIPELTMGIKQGSYGERVLNWFNMATSGRLDAKTEQSIISEIRRAANNSATMANNQRLRVEQEQKGIAPEDVIIPTSSNLVGPPSGGGAKFDWNSAPVHK